MVISLFELFILCLGYTHLKERAYHIKRISNTAKNHINANRLALENVKRMMALGYPDGIIDYTFAFEMSDLKHKC